MCTCYTSDTVTPSNVLNLRASDDVQESDKVRSLLKDIREVRQAKSRDGLQNIDRSELAVRLVFYFSFFLVQY